MATRFESAIPKTLRQWIETHPDVVYAISYEGGYATESGRAYDILLMPGFTTDEGMHTIIESTVAETLRQLRTVQPGCKCKECAR